LRHFAPCTVQNASKLDSRCKAFMLLPLVQIHFYCFAWLVMSQPTVSPFPPIADTDPGFNPLTPGYKNLFFFPHKAFRQMWFELSLLSNRCDWEDKLSVQQLSEKVKTAVLVYKEHNLGETKYFLPLVGDKQIYDLWSSDHSCHNVVLDNMLVDIEKILLLSDPNQRRSQGIQFCWKLSEFMVDDLKHMHLEETVIQDSINSRNSPEMIANAEKQLIMNANPEFMKMIMPFFFIAHDSRSVAFFCRCIKMQQTAKGAPPEAWSAVMSLALTTLGQERFNKAAVLFPEMSKC